jgi:hypothetical protein
VGDDLRAEDPVEDEYDVVDARKPFTSGERMCCEARSADQRPYCASVSIGKRTTPDNHPAKLMAATTSGALTARRCTRGGGASEAPQRKKAMIGQRYSTHEPMQAG